MKELTIIMTAVAIAVMALVVAQIANPCLLVGHDPLADCPQNFSIVLTGDASVRWSVVVNVCGRKFRVCRRCRMVYLERAELGEVKKP